MRVYLMHGEWYLLWGREEPDFEYRQFKGGRASALTWLRQFRTRGSSMAALRRTHKAIGLRRQVDDDSLMRDLAWALEAGRLKAIQREVAFVSGPSEEEPPAPGPAFPLESRRAATSSGPAPADGPLLPDDADAAAIAEALLNAARQGLPFCEECLRAALEAR